MVGEVMTRQELHKRYTLSEQEAADFLEGLSWALKLVAPQVQTLNSLVLRMVYSESASPFFELEMSWWER